MKGADVSAKTSHYVTAISCPVKRKAQTEPRFLRVKKSRKWKSMKLIGIAALFLAALGISSAGYQLVLEAALFLAVFMLQSKTFLWLNVVGLATVLAALAGLKARPRLFMPSRSPIRLREANHRKTERMGLRATTSLRRDQW